MRPVVEAILAHPDLYDAGKRMVKPPVVQCAGMLRAVGRGIDTRRLGRGLCEAAGQYLFLPPNVSGWDDTRWLDTATFRARWQMAQYICEPARLDPGRGTPLPPTRRSSSRQAAAFSGRRGSPGRSAPASSATPPTRSPPPTSSWKQDTYPVLALNALRMLVATSPDYLTS